MFLTSVSSYTTCSILISVFPSFTSVVFFFSSKRRKEEVAKEAEYEEANNPVDGVNVNDDHVHVEVPASRVVVKVQRVQAVASSMGELATSDWTGRSLEAWCGRK